MFGKLARPSRRCVYAVGVASCMLMAVAGTASAASVVIDGFNVTFNALPTADITTGLTPTSLVVDGVTYPPTSTLIYPGGAGWSKMPYFGTSNPWGATNPFQYSTTLNGSLYAGIWNGAATYVYSSPQSVFSILWGTPGFSDEVEFFAKNGTPLGTIVGADLIAAATASVPGFSIADGANISVPMTTPYYSVSVIGGPTLTFEYSNLVSTSSVPEPASVALLGTGLIAIALVSARRYLNPSPAGYRAGM